ncbi:MAG: hypothetical protein Q8K65_05455 [Alphaproteobacteria bacterium]|nr:hypothetical protein [Alphaproteobacteria bacterium]
MRQTSRPADHRPVFDVAALPWAALSAACARGDTAPLESLWQEHKRPEQARAAAIRAVFTGACAAKNLPLAKWISTLYPQHIDTKTLRHTAAEALRQSHGDVWSFLCAQIDARPAAAAADIYKNLFKTALEHAPVTAVQKIFPHMGASASGYLYAAVLGDNMPALAWLTEACHGANSLRPPDLDKALLLACERAQTPMAVYLLGAGADAGAFGEAALKRAAPHTDADDGALLELLVRAGAHPQKAQDIARAAAGGDALAQRLAKAAEETAAHHLRLLTAHCAAPLNDRGTLADDLGAAQLGGVQAALGCTGLHYAAEHHLLHRLPKNSFTAGGLAQKNTDGETAVDVLVRRGVWADFFKPEDWTAQVEKLAAALDLLPTAVWDDAARAACLRTAERLTLDAAVPAEGFTLTRRPKR